MKVLNICYLLLTFFGVSLHFSVLCVPQSPVSRVGTAEPGRHHLAAPSRQISDSNPPFCPADLVNMNTDHCLQLPIMIQGKPLYETQALKGGNTNILQRATEIKFNNRNDSA